MQRYPVVWCALEMSSTSPPIANTHSDTVEPTASINSESINSESIYCKFSYIQTVVHTQMKASESEWSNKTREFKEFLLGKYEYQ